VAQALSEMELAKAMAITDFFIIFSPDNFAADIAPGPYFPGDGAPVTIAATTMNHYRSGFATNRAFDRPHHRE
jgi:hypothetical protein